MKSVLMSIQPKWCELIANEKKTVEVRKTKPKTDVPFKVYIYCTSVDRVNLEEYTRIHLATSGRIDEWHGKVIGEFVCDSVSTDKSFGHNVIFKTKACMTDADVSSYCLNKEMYCWHISDLVIYDKPRELSEFRYYNCTTKTENGFVLPTRQIKRPPQSWCYVEGGAE